MAESEEPDHSTLVEIYRKMALIKTYDERIRGSAKSGRINLSYYSPRGQEVVPSALSVHLDDADYVCTIYRGIHDQLANGVPSKVIWAEYAGRVTGSCKGKGGPMHITYPDKGVMVTTGVVGSSMPIANGLALAKDGIGAEVMDLRTVAPYNVATVLASVRKTGRAVIVHEAVRNFGVGAEIAEQLHCELKGPVRRVGGTFNAVLFSKPLETAHVPDVKRILQAARSTLSR